jgi:hypothetical protein
MRLALITSKVQNEISVKVGILPNVNGFPVILNFKAGKLAGAQVNNLAATSADLGKIGDAGAILSNIATLLEKGEIKLGATGDQFATAIEERHGRQVVETSAGTLITIGKIKEKAEGVKNFRPIVSGKKVDDKELIVEAENEKEATKKMQIRFVTAASDDKKLALLIGTWLADGCKVEEIAADLPKDYIDLHTIK